MDEESKVKHSKRLLQKHKFVKKQERLAKTYGLDVEEAHRYQKRNVLNCGNPNCVMCANPRKIFKEKTVKEKSFEQTSDWTET